MKFSSFSFTLFLTTCVIMLDSNTLISQAPLLAKSVLTQSGSRSVSLSHTDINGVLVTTKVLQSIGQNGLVGFSRSTSHSVQQGFLNRTKTLNFNNSMVEFIELIDLIVYPNPFTEYIKIKFSKPTVYPVQIEVFDVRGRLVLDKDFPPSSQITVSTERLENASYIVRISSGSMEFLKKLIK